MQNQNKDRISYEQAKQILKNRFKKETALKVISNNNFNNDVKEENNNIRYNEDMDYKNAGYDNVNYNENTSYNNMNYNNMNYKNVEYDNVGYDNVNYNENSTNNMNYNDGMQTNYNENMNYTSQQTNYNGENFTDYDENIIDEVVVQEQKTKNEYSPETAKERQKERFIRKSTHISSKYIRKMQELKDSPNNIQYFEKLLQDVFVNLQDVKKDEDVKTIGTYCVMVPSELIYAAGAMPVKLCCGNYTSFDIGEENAPRDACPLVKAVIGSNVIKTLPIYDNCSLMVVPTTCDCKKKMAFEIGKYKKTMSMHIPSSKKDDEDLEYFVDDLYRFRNELEKITGNKITYKKLLGAIELVAETQYEVSRFYELKKNAPSLIKGTHAMAIMNAYSYDRIDRWGNALRLLNDELEMNLSNKKFVSKSKQPRIMITGSPIVFPNIKIPLLIEEMGGVLVADETCMGERGVYDPVAVVDKSFDGLMRSLAKRYILPCSCPTFVNNEQRIFKIKQMITDNKVEGVVYHVLRGCLVYDYEYQLIEEELEKIGIPIIRLETDYNEEDIEQLRIRIEAFIEMIKFENLKKE